MVSHHKKLILGTLILGIMSFISRNSIFVVIASITQEGIIALVAALFALLLPLMILLLENDKDIDLKWNKLVLIELIIKPKEFLILISCQLLPLLWWGADKTPKRNFILFFFILFGLYLYSMLLYRIYKWLSHWNDEDFSSYQSKQRLKYVINYTRQDNNIIGVWKSILAEQKNIDSVFATKKQFIENFFELIQQEKIKQTTRNELLNFYANLIDSIELNNYDDIKMFYEQNIHFTTPLILNNSNLIDHIEKHILRTSMTRTIKRMKKSSEVEQDIFFHTLVIMFKNFDEKEKYKFVNSFGEELIKFDYSANRFSSYWDYFPYEWKIDGENDMTNVNKNPFFHLLFSILFKEVTDSKLQKNNSDANSLINYQNLIDNMLLNIDLIAFGDLFYLFSLLRFPSNPLFRKEKIEELQLLLKKWMLIKKSFGWASGVNIGYSFNELLENSDNKEHAFSLIKQMFDVPLLEKNHYLITNLQKLKFESDDLMGVGISLKEANLIKNNKIRLLKEFNKNFMEKM